MIPHAMRRGLVSRHSILTEIPEYLRPHCVDLRKTVDPAAGLVKDHSNDRKPEDISGKVKRRSWPEPVAATNAIHRLVMTRRRRSRMTALRWVLSQ
jgi:hypothetical protein